MIVGWSLLGHVHSYIPLGDKGAPNGVATLDSSAKLAFSQHPGSLIRIGGADLGYVSIIDFLGGVTGSISGNVANLNVAGGGGGTGGVDLTSNQTISGIKSFTSNPTVPVGAQGSQVPRADDVLLRAGGTMGIRGKRFDTANCLIGC